MIQVWLPTTFIVKNFFSVGLGRQGGGPERARNAK
jgi:hypothetical protein